MRSSTLAWSSMPQRGTEVAGVEHVSSTDLGKGHDRRMEHGRDGRRKYGRGHAEWVRGASGGGASEEEVHPASSA
jgi:hypothetical protein